MRPKRHPRVFFSVYSQKYRPVSCHPFVPCFSWQFVVRCLLRSTEPVISFIVRIEHRSCAGWSLHQLFVIRPFFEKLFISLWIVWLSSNLRRFMSKSVFYLDLVHFSNLGGPRRSELYCPIHFADVFKGTAFWQMFTMSFTMSVYRRSGRSFFVKCHIFHISNLY